MRKKLLMLAFALLLSVGTVGYTKVDAYAAESCTGWVNQGGTYGTWCDYNSGICNLINWSHSQFAKQDQMKVCLVDGYQTIYLQTLTVKTGCCS